MEEFYFLLAIISLLSGVLLGLLAARDWPCLHRRPDQTRLRELGKKLHQLEGEPREARHAADYWSSQCRSLMEQHHPTSTFQNDDIGVTPLSEAERNCLKSIELRLQQGG